MNNFKNTLQFLNLSFKKEVIKLLIINLVIIAIIAVSYFFIKEIYIFIMIIFGGVFIDYYLISSYGQKRDRILRNREDEFVSMISYFKIFIGNQNNVYHSFECLLPYASEWMANEINNLLGDMDRDKTVRPFIDFAKQFNSPTIESVMLSIFQMIDEGGNENRLNHFNFSFEQFSINHKDALIDAKQKSLDSISSLSRLAKLLFSTGSSVMKPFKKSTT